jgi:hypothetical protein
MMDMGPVDLVPSGSAASNGAPPMRRRERKTARVSRVLRDRLIDSLSG